MNWQEIVKEQYGELATAIKVAQGKDRSVAKAILDDAEKKIKKEVNPKPDKAKDELHNILNKVKKNPRDPLTPAEKMTLDKMSEAKDFKEILAQYELIDEALFGLIKDKPKYVKYKYRYATSDITVNGIGEVVDNKIKKIGFEYFNKDGKAFKIVPKEKFVDLKFKTQELTKEDFDYAVDSVKLFPLAKSFAL